MEKSTSSEFEAAKAAHNAAGISDEKIRLTGENLTLKAELANAQQMIRDCHKLAMEGAEGGSELVAGYALGRIVALCEAALDDDDDSDGDGDDHPIY